MKSSRCATNPERGLKLFVPDFEALIDESEAVPAPVAALLARGQRHSPAGDNPQAWLMTGTALPPAPLRRRVQVPRDAGGLWLCADPVRLQPDLAAVWVDDDARFDRDDAAVNAALAEIGQVLAEEGLAFELVTPRCGYVRLDAAPDCEFRPPWRLAGRSLEQLLPAGPDAARWRRLINECQVILHQAAARAGDAAGVPGGLWFWGAGRLPHRRPRSVARVLGHDPAVEQAAHWLEVPVEAPAGRIRAENGTLAVWRPDHRAAADDNLRRLARWLRPAWRRLRFGRLESIGIGGYTHYWQLSAAQSWRLWRRRP